jgi:hypothetical protein
LAGRAYAISRESAKARAYFEEFSRWKNGDPEILVLKQAEAEYTKLR